LSSLIFLVEKMNFEQALTDWNGNKARGAQTRLAKIINVAPNTVSQWCSGKSKPGPDLEEKVARAMRISIDELRGYFDRKLEGPSGVDAMTVRDVSSFAPVLGIVTADSFAFSMDAIAEEQIPNPYPGKNVFALRVSGDCMEPTFRDGEYIYFSRTQPVIDGKIVLARLDGQHTMKRYFKRADGIELRPDNTKYRSRTYTTNKLEIIAVAVGRYGKL
jgi:repressor LexA